MTDTQFDGIETSAFREASGMMQFVGIFWIVLAALTLASVGVVEASVLGSALAGHGGSPSAVFGLLLDLIDKAALMGAGVYTLLTAASIRRTIASQSNQIGAMMIALRNLRGLFVCYAAVVGIDLFTDVLQLAKG